MSFVNKIRGMFETAWRAAGYEILPSEPLIHPLFRGFNPSAGEGRAKESLEKNEDFRQAVHAIALREYDRGGTWPHSALFEMAACFVRPCPDLVSEMAVNIQVLKSLGIWPLWAKVWAGGQRGDYYIAPDHEANAALEQLGIKLVWDTSDETLLYWGRSTLADTIPVLAPRAEIYFGDVEVAMFERIRLQINPESSQLEKFRPMLVMGIGLDRLVGIILGYRPGLDDITEILVSDGIDQSDALRAVDALRAIMLPMAEGAKPGGSRHENRARTLRSFFSDLLSIELQYPDKDWDEVYQRVGEKLREHFEGVHEVGIEEFFSVLPRERELAAKKARSTGPQKGSR